jgi:heme-degrading monooxygenase HmoA
VIARTWRGSTRPADADRYIDYMQETGFKEILETHGNLGVIALRRPIDDRVEFLFVSFWESIDAVRRFAGEDYRWAVFYPEDDAYLIDRDLHVDHHEVVTGEVPILWMR